MGGRVKVTYTVAVEVDRDAWELTYGTGGSAAEVRENVKSYLREQVQGCAAADECGLTIVRDNS